MKLTKYAHACFAVERDGASIALDPASFSTNLVIPANGIKCQCLIETESIDI